MKYLNYLKKYDHFDSTLLLFDELGFTDEEIIALLEVSKQYIYNVKRRNTKHLSMIRKIDE